MKPKENEKMLIERPLPPRCPDCGGPMFCAGGSHLTWTVNGDGADPDSLRCEDLEGCDGGLEIVVSPSVVRGYLFTVEGALFAKPQSAEHAD